MFVKNIYDGDSCRFNSILSLYSCRWRDKKKNGRATAAAENVLRKRSSKRVRVLGPKRFATVPGEASKRQSGKCRSVQT